jgi:hypothetical protein
MAAAPEAQEAQGGSKLPVRLCEIFVRHSLALMDPAALSTTRLSTTWVMLSLNSKTQNINTQDTL